MKIKTPKLPDPKAIRNEIDELKTRIGELRALLPLAEAQHFRRSLAGARDHKLLKGTA